MVVVEGAVAFTAKDGMLDSVGVGDVRPAVWLKDLKAVSGVGR